MSETLERIMGMVENLTTIAEQHTQAILELGERLQAVEAGLKAVEGDVEAAKDVAYDARDLAGERP